MPASGAVDISENSGLSCRPFGDVVIEYPVYELRVRCKVNLIRRDHLTDYVGFAAHEI